MSRSGPAPTSSTSTAAQSRSTVNGWKRIGRPYPGWALGAAGERFEVEVQDDRSRQIEALTGQGRKVAAGGVVKAPMPGLVVRVEVSEGKAVEVGEGLVVVEAMKMENELRATYKGVVERIHVKAGDRVEKGAPLVTLSPQPSQPSG